MPTLGEYRHAPGQRLNSDLGPLMVIELAIGMCRDGCTVNGGAETVPVVSLISGRAHFEHVSLEVSEPEVIGE